ncbi:MAG: hypothetical protein A2V74_03745 [Acidobacteria bacterium RBG_16_70_10]|nr:MAG: hypothetical protein A2V74_03745 [Acidobacteria bacterium RBG_16_70_10]
MRARTQPPATAVPAMAATRGLRSAKRAIVASSNRPKNRSIAVRSYSMRETRSRPGQKSFGCAEARRTPRTASSAASSAVALASASTRGSSIALPRALSRRSTPRRPRRSIRMPLIRVVTFRGLSGVQ